RQQRVGGQGRVGTGMGVEAVGEEGHRGGEVVAAVEEQAVAVLRRAQLGLARELVRVVALARGDVAAEVGRRGAGRAVPPGQVDGAGGVARIAAVQRRV